ncbi:MAG: SCO family protein [Steroidobacteraceae bacterium]
MTFRTTAIISVLAAMAIGFAAAMLSSDRQPVSFHSGTALPDPRPVADFALVDHHGESLTRAVFSGRWSLVFTGFTNCPDICPTTLALLADVAARLRARGGDLQLLFVSVDPERDTPAALAQYVAHFDPRMIGATGTPPQVDSFGAGLGLAHLRNPGAGGAYTVDHSAALVLIDPEARIAGYFQPPFDPEVLAADLVPLFARRS